MRFEIYGASDDLVEIEGDYCEEFSVSQLPTALSFSDGTLLEIDYRGDWVIRIIELGRGASAALEEPKGDSYTERLHLVTDFDVEWIMCGQYRRVKGKQNDSQQASQRVVRTAQQD